VHRDEATADQLAAATSLPSIIVRDGDGWTEAVSTAEIATYKGSAELLLERLATV